MYVYIFLGTLGTFGTITIKALISKVFNEYQKTFHSFQCGTHGTTNPFPQN